MFFQKTERLLAALLGLVLYSACSQSPSKNQPNIILIMADDLGYGEVGCYGSGEVSTPNIDYLSQNGLTFTDFHSNGSVCSPTRAALMTGRYQQRSGVNGVVTARYHRHHGLDPNTATIADVMKSAGYKTAIFGKWHLGYDVKYNPIHHGFDEFAGYVGGNIDFISHLDQEGFRDWWHDTEKVDEEGYCTDLITAHALNFIDKNSDKPFFLYLPYEPPHYPIQGRKDPAFRKLIDGKDGYHEYIAPDSTYNVASSYKEMIEVMDEGIGEIIADLREKELLDNTVIVFCSDNGPTGKVPLKGEHNATAGFKGSKNSIYEGGHRVPGIIHWPASIKAGRNASTIMTMDLLPTFAQLAGADINELQLDGIDISPVFEHESLPKRDLYWLYHQGAVRRGDWKLIVSREQLYNLKDDPYESDNLFKDPKNAALIESMLQSYEQMKEEVEASAPEPVKAHDTRIERGLEKQKA